MRQLTHVKMSKVLHKNNYDNYHSKQIALASNSVSHKDSNENSLFLQIMEQVPFM